MKKSTILIATVLFFLAGCQRSCTRMSRKLQVSERFYVIKMYSGGKIVFSDSLKTIINDAEGSDGCYYYNTKGELVEISGDYVIKSK